jgi:hypothetical protein
VRGLEAASGRVGVVCTPVLRRAGWLCRPTDMRGYDPTIFAFSGARRSGMLGARLDFLEIRLSLPGLLASAVKACFAGVEPAIVWGLASAVKACFAGVEPAIIWGLASAVKACFAGVEPAIIWGLASEVKACFAGLEPAIAWGLASAVKACFAGVEPAIAWGLGLRGVGSRHWWSWRGSSGVLWLPLPGEASMLAPVMNAGVHIMKRSSFLQ